MKNLYRPLTEKYASMENHAISKPTPTSSLTKSITLHIIRSGSLLPTPQ